MKITILPNNKGQAKEVYLPIKGHEGCYEISNHGRVLSCNRTIQRGKIQQVLKEKILSNKFDGRYEFVKLSKDGVRKNMYIHRLVALHFVLNDKNITDVNHKDSDKRNNYFENLEWLTKSDNAIHASVNNLLTYQIPNEMYLRVLELRASGLTYVKIEELTGVERSSARCLVTRSVKSKNGNYERFKN